MNKLILVTNDDGIHAPGIHHLVKQMSYFGQVYVVAPDSAQSGMGHAITTNRPLSYKPEQIPHATKAYSVSGTPADCVKIGLHKLLPRKPDLCVSGINHGSNKSINIVYSGTMGAALEGGIEGIPSIGFSLLDFDWKADFEPALPYVYQIVKNTLVNGLPKETVLNVNIPKTADIKGIKVCRQGKGNWEETLEERKNPAGKPYFWLEGIYHDYEPEATDTDNYALQQNFISIVPCEFDLTKHQVLTQLREQYE